MRAAWRTACGARHDIPDGCPQGSGRRPGRATTKASRVQAGAIDRLVLPRGHTAGHRAPGSAQTRPTHGESRTTGGAQTRGSQTWQPLRSPAGSAVGFGREYAPGRSMNETGFTPRTPCARDSWFPRSCQRFRRTRGGGRTRRSAPGCPGKPRGAFDSSELGPACHGSITDGRICSSGRHRSPARLHGPAGGVLVPCGRCRFALRAV